jgi:monoamine oxidase
MSRSLFARLHRRFGTRLSGAERQQRVRDRLKSFHDDFPITGEGRAGLRPGGVRSVIVIGGGFAGLMAGRMLAGLAKVRVFEARDRWGGRVWSRRDSTSKRITEAGAELIGYAHAAWLSLAKEYDLGLSVWTSEHNYDAIGLNIPTYLGGKLLSAKEAERIYHGMYDAFASMTREAQTIVNAHQPWLAPDAEGLDKMPLAAWIAARPPEIQGALEAEFSNTNAAPSIRQSYLANLALVAGAARHGHPGDFFTMSENVRCQQGNQALAEAMALDIVERGGELKPSHPVVRIDVKPGSVAIRAANGHDYEADCAILAIPPSLWPNAPGATLVVNPEIPSDHYMTMGTAVKYLSTSDTRFWLKDGLAPSCSSEQFGMLWEGTDNQMQLPGQVVELTVFAGGPLAEDALAAYRPEEKEAIRAFYDQRIGEIYGAYRSQRKDTTFVPWPRDPWTHGGYSCPAPGDVCRVGRYLDAPLHGRLYFAGEHTCLPFFGYMEGALQSGARAALQILNL